MAGESGARTRLLTFSTLYPNACQPTHGIFVETRLRHLLATGAVQSTVLAPVPFYPRWLPGPHEWRRRALVPNRERRHGIDIAHPRYLVIPKLGMSVAPLLLYRASLPAARRLIAAGTPVDLIDAHYVYPDGVAAVRMGQTLGLPVVITARGSDVTQLPDFARPRRQITWAIARADALIAVSAALAERLVELGAHPDRVRVLRNGVDTTLFRPADRATARADLRLDGPTLVSVGYLIPRKGHDRTLTALASLPGVTLLLVGEGPERAALEALARRLGVSDRVRFLGAKPQGELPRFYTAADAMVLASSREGWANVLLESMACGTPVVASPIPGNPEVVQAREAGLIAATNTSEGIAEAVRDLLASPPDRAATRAYAERFNWDEVSAGQRDVFDQVLRRR